jgi:hypothetical protein
MTHWLAVTTPANWSLCSSTKTWGVTDRFANMLKRVIVDDDLLIYIVGMKCAGIFKVIKPYFNDQKLIWPDDVYPHRINFEPSLGPPEPVDIKQFYYAFFQASSPAGYFRTQFREMPDGDYELFADFLRSGKVQTLEPLATAPPESEFALSIERDLEDYLESHIQTIEPGLKLYREEDLKGRQFGTDVSRIDLLGQDPGGNLVVIELKAGEADRAVLGQILPYMGWVRQNLAKGKAVRGVVVASDFSQDLLFAINELSNLSLFRYSVQFMFKKVAPPVPMMR